MVYFDLIGREYVIYVYVTKAIWRLEIYYYVSIAFLVTYCVAIWVILVYYWVMMWVIWSLDSIDLRYVIQQLQVLLMSNRQVILVPVFKDYASAEFICEAEGCLVWLKITLQNMVRIFVIFEHLEKLTVWIIFLVARVLCFFRLKTNPWDQNVY